MNEHVARLAEEATYIMEFTDNDSVLETSCGDISYRIPAEFIKTFAGLIVKECSTLLTRQGEQWIEFGENPPTGQEHTGSPALFAGHRLKEDAVAYLEEYFGVEK